MNAKDVKLYEEYINIYNEIDEFMRKTLKTQDFVDHIGLIEQMSAKDRFFANYANDLKNLAKLRNVLEHNPYRAVAHPMATPNPLVVEKYKQLRNTLLQPPLALSIAVPGPNVYTTTLSASAGEVMLEMDKNTYTHVPVIEDGKMIGVFSENVILAYLAENKEGIITQSTKMEEFKNFLPIKKHHSESFKFIPRTALVSDVFKIFGDAIKVRDRVGLIFITQNGKPDEKFLGILTAWDLAGYDELVIG